MIISPSSTSIKSIENKVSSLHASNGTLNRMLSGRIGVLWSAGWSCPVGHRSTWVGNWRHLERGPCLRPQNHTVWTRCTDCHPQERNPRRSNHHSCLQRRTLCSQLCRPVGHPKLAFWYRGSWEIVHQPTYSVCALEQLVISAVVWQGLRAIVEDNLANGGASVEQVWPLTQFFSVSFL